MNTPQDLYDVLKKYGYKSVNEQQDGQTPLMRAVLVSDRRAVETLTAFGADLELKDNKGRTALYIAVEYGLSDITRMLLDRGADIHTKNAEGHTPMQCARRYEEIFARWDTGDFYTRIRQMLEAKAIQNPPPQIKAIMPQPRKKPSSKRFSL